MEHSGRVRFHQKDLGSDGKCWVCRSAARRVAPTPGVNARGDLRGGQYAASDPADGAG